MSWIRIEQKYTGGGAQFDGVCENINDLTYAAAGEITVMGKKYTMGPGSIAFCTENGKMYILDSSKIWQEVE